ncbi:cytochrome c biogenesis protein DipZ [Legionella jordanis]|nr:cytochrome c biogenesis protein DipZ [Legionella jordanis]
MEENLLTVALAFIEGFALIISPCILPILPIVLAGSLSGSRVRPFGIIIGFVVSFSLLAFFSRQLVQYAGLNLDLLRNLSYSVLVLLAIIMFFTSLSERFSYLVNRLIGESRFSQANPSQGGFLSALFFGGLIAIIWTPCAGPILAAVIVQTVLQKTTIISFFILLSFALGAGLPMLIIALYGMQLVKTFQFFKTKAQLFRKILAVIIILAVAFMVYQDTALTTGTATTTIKTANYLEDALWIPYKAPPIEGIEAWINSKPLQLSQLEGKVVLIDFWTYSCINCLRTLPYLKGWYQKYQKDGLIVIGVHSPEFDFERKATNVEQAVKRYGITYPVALDNQFVTWRNYKNNYWPAHYLIDKNGKVVYEHFGEGDYDITENNIRYLLSIKSAAVPSFLGEDNYSISQTPETYLGYYRADKDVSPALVKDAENQYQFPTQLPVNAWGLQGGWKAEAHNILATQKDAAVKIHFKAKQVFVVMGNATTQPINVKVLLNNALLTAEAARDVHNSNIVVNKDSLYEVISLVNFSEGVLELIASSPGLRVYTFTFGG